LLFAVGFLRVRAEHKRKFTNVVHRSLELCPELNSGLNFEFTKTQAIKNLKKKIINPIFTSSNLKTKSYEKYFNPCSTDVFQYSLQPIETNQNYAKFGLQNFCSE
jgi:hypothetical protein